MDRLVALLKIVIPPPLSLAVLAILGWMIGGRWPRLGRTTVWVSLVPLYLLATPFISSLLLGSLQWFPALTTTQVNHPAANAIVILSADVDPEATEYGGSIPGPLTLERLEYGARLARDLQLPILVTGGKI